MTDFSKSIVRLTRAFSRAVDKLTFNKPVAYVYNPLSYAGKAHELFLHTYAHTQKNTLFLGMNPGPFGMAQTGVPFGEVNAVRNWLKIEAEIKKPPREHPKRPILGFDCHRNEVSGQRLWGLFAQEFTSAKVFFKHHFVINYCPLVFMSETGKNITPVDMKKAEVEQLYFVCDEYLRKFVKLFSPQNIVGIGKFAAARARKVFSEDQFAIYDILHPSPASPLANKGWGPQAKKQLIEHGIWKRKK